MTPLADYLRRETRISIAINSVLSLLFYVAFFRPFADVALAWRGLGFDFVPQSFAITLMSVLVPGYLTRRRLAARTIAPLEGRSVLPRALPWRGLVLAVAAAGVGAAFGIALGAVTGGVVVHWGVGAAIKIAYGAALAAVVTPIGVRAALLAAPTHFERKTA